MSFDELQSKIVDSAESARAANRKDRTEFVDKYLDEILDAADQLAESIQELDFN